MSDEGDFDLFLKFSRTNGLVWEKWQKDVAKSFFTNQETFLVCPRQNGKTELMIWLALFVFFMKDKSVYFSTHSQKAWFKLRGRIQREINSRKPLVEFLVTHLNGMVKTPITNKLTGSILIIDHRTDTSATGDSYDYNFIDECQFLTNGQIASLFPTMATKKSKIFYGGTSPAPKYDFFIKMWEREQDNDNFFYYGIPSEKNIPANLNDEKVLELVKKTNPNYPAYLKKESILLEYKRLSRADFIRERLGVIDYTMSNLFFNERKIQEQTFKLKEFERATLGVYAMGSRIALCLADRTDDTFYLQPLGIYNASDNEILNYLIARKNKIKEIKVSGSDYAIYDKWTKALGKNRYVIMKAPHLYQRDTMTKDYYSDNKLYLPSNEDSWKFLLDIQYETMKSHNGIRKDYFFSYDKESNAEYQALANSLFGANNLDPIARKTPRKRYVVA